MAKKTVKTKSIRVSEKAHLTLRVKSAKTNKTIIELVDALLETK